MSTIPGLHVAGEANFSDHGANRLGASALMQGLADGYFVLPHTIGSYLAGAKLDKMEPSHPAMESVRREVEARLERMVGNRGGDTVDSFHRKLGRIMWNECGMSRTKSGLTSAIGEIQELRARFWSTVSVTGSKGSLNQVLERAGRVADFLELGELMCRDALVREESCGGHFRDEHQTPEGEALRDDENFCHVAAWEYQGDDAVPNRHIEPLSFEYVKLVQRSYK
jgi:succinate dehydrogenase / fumarate reductase, flavoprotein subunit